VEQARIELRRDGTPVVVRDVDVVTDLHHVAPPGSSGSSITKPAPDHRLGDRSGLHPVDVLLDVRQNPAKSAITQMGALTRHEWVPTLLRVASHIDASKHGNPAFLAVITGWGFAYRRPDDVLVIPIGALAP